MIVEYLKTLAARAGLSGNWESWDLQYRVLAVTLGLLLIHLAMRAIGPVAQRMLRPLLFLVFVLAVLFAVYPTQTCSIEFLSKLPILCAR